MILSQDKHVSTFLTRLCIPSFFLLPCKPNLSLPFDLRVNQRCLHFSLSCKRNLSTFFYYHASQTNITFWTLLQIKLRYTFFWPSYKPSPVLVFFIVVKTTPTPTWFTPLQTKYIRAFLISCKIKMCLSFVSIAFLLLPNYYAACLAFSCGP